MQTLDISLYRHAMQNPSRVFEDGELRGLSVECDANGAPRPFVGGFAMVFRLRGRDKHSPGVAVRCFKRLMPDLADRYQRISTTLNHQSSLSTRFFVKTRYIERGVLAGGVWRPVTTLQWVNGQPLAGFFHSAAGNRTRMERMLAQVKLLAVELERWQIAHGDLQHENILVGDDDHLRLIDYDGMYVPALKGMSSNEAGHPDYRHPGRRGDAAPHIFDTKMDRFPLIVIYFQVAAVAAHPELWSERPAESEGLLLHEQDFLEPEASPTLRRLATFDDLRRGVEHLSEIASAPIDTVPTLATFIARTNLLVPRTTLPPPRPIARSGEADRREAEVDHAGQGVPTGLHAIEPQRDLILPVIPPSPSDLTRYIGTAIELVGQIERRTIRKKGGRERTTYLYLRSYGVGTVRIAIPRSVANSDEVTAAGIGRGTWVAAVGTLNRSQLGLSLYVTSLRDIVETTEAASVARVKASRRQYRPVTESDGRPEPASRPEAASRPAPSARPRKTASPRAAASRRRPRPLGVVLPYVRSVGGQAPAQRSPSQTPARRVRSQAPVEQRVAEQPNRAAELAKLLGLREGPEEKDR